MSIKNRLQDGKLNSQLSKIPVIKGTVTLKTNSGLLEVVPVTISNESVQECQELINHILTKGSEDLEEEGSMFSIYRSRLKI